MGMNEKRVWQNPLDWWKIQTKYRILRDIAQTILSITASSAPSERFWSRLANILSAKRARLKMFVKENLSILREHYKLLTQKNREVLPLELIGIPLPDDVSDIDVGQDLFDINAD